MNARLVFALAVLAAWPALAQTRQPAQITTLPTTTPQEFDLLDKTGAWVPLGAGAGALDPRSFHARCDGTTDDTTALANWAAAIQSNSKVYIPGVCITKAPIVFPPAHRVALFGDGYATSRLVYAGTDTTVTPFSFGAVITTGCQFTQWSIHDVGFFSTTTMTAGDGVRYNGLCDSDLNNTAYGGALSQVPGADKNFFNGVHFSVGNIIHVRGLFTAGHGVGQGVVLNGGAVANTDQLVGPSFNQIKVSGFDVGVNVAGNVGGLYMDQTDILNNNTNLRISQDQVAVGNTQIILGATTSLDITFSGSDIDIVDPGGTQPYLLLNGTWIASGYSHLINVHSGSNWNITMNGGRLFNAGRVGTSPNADGLHNDSTTGKIQLNGVIMANNYGYGVNSTVANANIIVTSAIPYNNTLGSFSPNVTPLSVASDNTGFTSVVAQAVKSGVFTANNAAPSYQFRPVGGTQPADTKNWDLFEDSTGGNISLRALNDAFNSANAYMTVTRGTGFSLTGAKIGFTVPVSAANYAIGATLGFSGVKTAGTCVLTITGGIITNVTGC